MSTLAETTLIAGAHARVNRAPDGRIYLRPRPLALKPGSFVLLPLLPALPAVKELPAEIWARIFAPLLEDDTSGYQHAIMLMCVSKAFRDIILPILYSYVRIGSVKSLQAFTSHLFASDQKWDSIRRIPYSTPGRWIKTLDLSPLHATQHDTIAVTAGKSLDHLGIDELLSRVFPLLPFLEQLHLSPSHKALSRRALNALTHRDGTHRLRVVTGLKTPLTTPEIIPGHDPVVSLLRYSPHIEELEVIGTGLDDAEDAPRLDAPDSPLVPLKLDRLHSLSLLSMHHSNLLRTLIHTPLPALVNLAVTPDAESGAHLISSFLVAHGSDLVHLTVHPPTSSWPPTSYFTPHTVLQHAPSLTYLSLTSPLSTLTIPDQPHPLQVLSLPRPDSRILASIEAGRANLPHLRAVAIRDVRWLRPGVGGVALSAGTQGEMRRWKGRLQRKGVALLDADWALGA